MRASAMEPISNRASWIASWQAIDDETGDPIDLSDCSEIELQICDPITKYPLLSGSLTGGEITLESDNVTVTWTFTKAQMSGLDPRNYDVAIALTWDTPAETVTALVTTIIVYDGLIA